MRESRGAEARMWLDTGGVDDDRQRQRGRRSTEVAWTTLEGGGGDSAMWQLRAARVRGEQEIL
jgi:hypothetical protein